MENPALSEEHICKSCGHRFTGLYCNLCGEKVIEAKDRTFRTFLSNILIAITFADSKFVKTLWIILSRPGFLSAQYSEGIRVKYVRPLQMFFILNLIYFLFPVLQLFNSSLRTQMYYLAHGRLIRQLVVDRLLAENLSLEGFELMYNAKSASLAKLLVVVYVILAAIPLALLFIRKRNRYFTDHVTLSVELACFNMFVNAIFLSALLWAISKLFKISHLNWSNYLNDTTLTLIFVVTNLYFVYRAALTFYNQRGWKRIAKSIVMIIGLFLALETYRIILFFVTFWSV
ncbi:MAG: DUF3667 domain-containing protein [Cyclobacteriaceae bacterium]|nr:DUF3667 domain-containing protein [Cyclobacteriaceae bacterium]MDW8330869.1 DUF3667 domain-containing protein [Cyclobacteriaceae bacterium]